MIRILTKLFIVFAAVLFAFPVWAQQTGDPASPDSELGESAKAVHDLAGVKNKVLIFVFDVSGSMKGKELTRAREATLNLIREATGVGDRVVLFAFGADNHKIFDTTIRDAADKDILIEKVPNDTQPGDGTNIRRPHHEALKILEQELPRPGAVVLMTDSFNDEPKRNDAAFADYVKYYTPGGRLKKYPDTPENRDYERLLNKIYRSKKVKFYGFGVQIDESTGRPMEQLPQDAPVPPPSDSGASDTLPASATSAPKNDLTWVYVLLGVGAVGVVVFLLNSLAKPVSVRITTSALGKKDFKDYQIKGGQSLRLGGASAGFDGYPIAGTTQTIALIKSARGQMLLAIAPPAAGAAPALAKVFHNGVPLEKETPMRYGDEVRVNIPDPSGVARDIRLRIEDPKKTF